MMRKQRWIAAVTVVLAALLCGCSSRSLGVIGGADGPTAIIVSGVSTSAGHGGSGGLAVVAAVVIIAVVVVALLVRHHKKK